MFGSGLEKGPLCPVSDATFGHELGCCALAEVAAMETKASAPRVVLATTTCFIHLGLGVCRHVLLLLATATRPWPASRHRPASAQTNTNIKPSLSIAPLADSPTLCWWRSFWPRGGGTWPKRRGRRIAAGISPSVARQFFFHSHLLVLRLFSNYECEKGGYYSETGCSCG